MESRNIFKSATRVIEIKHNMMPITSHIGQKKYKIHKAKHKKKSVRKVEFKENFR